MFSVGISEKAAGIDTYRTCAVLIIRDIQHSGRPFDPGKTVAISSSISKDELGGIDGAESFCRTCESCDISCNQAILLKWATERSTHFTDWERHWYVVNGRMRPIVIRPAET